jgi:hypothetical protein
MPGGMPGGAAGTASHGWWSHFHATLMFLYRESLMKYMGGVTWL